ncbi:hypothetical protein [Petroclostridium sp. X23]|uniref:PTS sugar transporter subunit IIA n=1 Tax=Petroclostridium sp. X23 TaxID=3045146 RepID=UPI0024ACA315|nr:hypothetical protein [Petroclostridium sp. X23]WHH57156.1 hypothetical protein QKW49_15055 [Petroclostridium sp. X23]
MKNIILLTHGEFSKGMAQSCRYILGNVENIQAVSITLNESIEQICDMLDNAWRNFGNTNPVVVVTDLPGGSTTQAAIKFLSVHKNFYLITGLNLGLLLELIMAELTEDYNSNLVILGKIVEESKQTVSLINGIHIEAEEDVEGEL